MCGVGGWGLFDGSDLPSTQSALSPPGVIDSRGSCVFTLGAGRGIYAYNYKDSKG